MRLADAAFERTSNAFRSRIVLEAPDGRRYEGRAELPHGEGNDLRAACRATVEALRQLAGDAVELELIGVRTLPLEGGQVIVAQVGSRRAGKPRLLQGAALASASSDLDAARAVLHATNRLLEDLPAP